MEPYQALLESIVKTLVDHPEEVRVVRTTDEMGVLLSVHVHPEDMGMLIGRSGSTVQAVRTLVRVAGYKSKARVNLKIEEPVGGHMQRPNPLADSQLGL